MPKDFSPDINHKKILSERPNLFRTLQTLLLKTFFSDTACSSQKTKQEWRDKEIKKVEIKIAIKNCTFTDIKLQWRVDLKSSSAFKK